VKNLSQKAEHEGWSLWFFRSLFHFSKQLTRLEYNSQFLSGSCALGWKMLYKSMRALSQETVAWKPYMTTIPETIRKQNGMQHIQALSLSRHHQGAIISSSYPRTLLGKLSIKVDKQYMRGVSVTSQIL
jgi:hypothetical protein